MVCFVAAPFEFDTTRLGRSYSPQTDERICSSIGLICQLIDLFFND